MKKLYRVEIAETGSMWRGVYYVAALGFDHAVRRVKTQIRRHESINRPRVVQVELLQRFLS